MTNETDRQPWSGVWDQSDPRGFLAWLQVQHAAWERYNFPMSESDVFHSLAGVTEEVGELAHALLKTAQNIRGSQREHWQEGHDAVGDVMIYMAGLCNKMGYDMQTCAERAWKEVADRDWTKNRMDGTS